MSVIEARNLVFSYSRTSPRVLDEVSVVIERGQTLGVVGASGSGKSTLGEVLGGLLIPQSGTLLLDGMDVGERNKRTRQKFARHVQFVFQDPQASIDATYSIRRAIEEPLRVLEPSLDARTRHHRCDEVLELVGLALDLADRKPHELSGGQCQRAAIARALVLRPDVVICDECTSALDVLVQARVLNLLRDIQSEVGCAYLFIGHNTGVVEYMADEVVVMNRGRVVESGSCASVFSSPQSDYTRRLIASSRGVSFANVGVA